MEQVVVAVVILLPHITGIGSVGAERNKVPVPHLPQHLLARDVHEKGHVEQTVKQLCRCRRAVKDNDPVGTLYLLPDRVNLCAVKYVLKPAVHVDPAEARIVGEKLLFVSVKRRLFNEKPGGGDERYLLPGFFKSFSDSFCKSVSRCAVPRFDSNVSVVSLAAYRPAECRNDVFRAENEGFPVLLRKVKDVFGICFV